VCKTYRERSSFKSVGRGKASLYKRRWLGRPRNSEVERRPLSPQEGGSRTKEAMSLEGRGPWSDEKREKGKGRPENRERRHGEKDPSKDHTMRGPTPNYRGRESLTREGSTRKKKILTQRHCHEKLKRLRKRTFERRLPCGQVVLSRDEELSKSGGTENFGRGTTNMNLLPRGQVTALARRSSEAGKSGDES